MVFKEFISALFEKWACKHDWKPQHISYNTDEWGVDFVKSFILNVKNVVNLRK